MQEFTTFLANHWALTLSTAMVFVLISFIEAARAKGKAFDINPLQATQKINHDHAAVIDVRSADAYKSSHIIGAHAVKIEEILKNPKKLEKFKACPLILIGQSGSEAQKIAAFLLKNGYNAYSLAGGMRAWVEAKMPVVKE
jgi:rhodanese-related sulfurtransferase